MAPLWTKENTAVTPDFVPGTITPLVARVVTVECWEEEGRCGKLPYVELIIS